MHGIHDDVLACAAAKPRKSFGAEKSAFCKRAALFRAALIGFNRIKITSNGAKCVMLKSNWLAWKLDKGPLLDKIRSLSVENSWDHEWELGRFGLRFIAAARLGLSRLIVESLIPDVASSKLACQSSLLSDSRTMFRCDVR